MGLRNLLCPRDSGTLAGLLVGHQPTCCLLALCPPSLAFSAHLLLHHSQLPRLWGWNWGIGVGLGVGDGGGDGRGDGA